MAIVTGDYRAIFRGAGLIALFTVVLSLTGPSRALAGWMVWSQEAEFSSSTSMSSASTTSGDRLPGDSPENSERRHFVSPNGSMATPPDQAGGGGAGLGVFAICSRSLSLKPLISSRLAPETRLTVTDPALSSLFRPPR